MQALELASNHRHFAAHSLHFGLDPMTFRDQQAQAHQGDKLSDWNRKWRNDKTTDEHNPSEYKLQVLFYVIPNLFHELSLITCKNSIYINSIKKIRRPNLGKVSFFFTIP